MKEKIITFGEIMLRLSPENSERFTQCHSFEAVYGGGEANTAVSSKTCNRSECSQCTASVRCGRQ